MPRIIVILMLISVLFYLVYRFKKIQTDKQKRIMKYLLIFIMVGVIAVLAVSGHLNWLIALIAALIPLVIRFFSSAMRWLPSLAVLFRKFQTMRSAQYTQIVTGFLRMEINQSTGDMRGQILQGEFKNKMLSGLGIEDLLKLLDSCQQQDKESAALLMAYLGNAVLTQLTDWFFKANLTDVLTMFQVTKTEIFKEIDIQSDRWGSTIEITAKFLKTGHRIYEVPVEYIPRRRDTGKKVHWSDFFSCLSALIKYRFFDKN